MADEPRKPRIRRRRIIERPRLIHALDRSSAGLRMLVGGSGFGKTTLAEQWAPRDGRSLGWFRAHRSAADVAVVARGLSTAAAVSVAGAGRRMLERLTVTEDPEREAILLAEMLVEDLQDWPDEGWIAIDDYQHLAVSAASEAFVQTIVQQTPVRMLLASRVRPSWVSARSILDGKVLEIPQAALAMGAEEIEEVLEGARTELTAGLLALAGGWPAVVGLAGMAPDAPYPDADRPETLYEFFAEELYRGLDPTVQTGLAVLAAMPLVDRELAETILGPERAARVCDEALSLGILEEREDRLELHPLVRSFFEAHESLEMSALPAATGEALTLYRRRREWDSAFELVREHDLHADFAGLVLEAVDETMYSGRLIAVDEWLRYARAKKLFPHPVFAVAETELHLRHGRHVTALTVARSAIDAGSATGEVDYRLSIAAARAAHVGSREEDALGYYRRALVSARTRLEKREARWGELMCTAALERPEAHVLLEKLEQSVVRTDARDQVRMADKQLSVGFRFGYVKHLADSRIASELVDQVDDPLVRCSFLSMHAWALALSAYYDEALTVSTRLIENATNFRVDPALPYGSATSAVALAGLGSTDAALRMVDDAHRHARRLNDTNGVQNAYAIRMRVLLQAGAAAEACATEPPDLAGALPSMRGEVLGSRALALVTIGRVGEAMELAEEAREATLGIETRALACAVSAVSAVKARSSDVLERCETLIDHVFEAGSCDLAVAAYRANPELLSTLLASARIRDKTVFLVRRAGDDRRLETLGMSSAALVDPVISLSPREREVYDLLCEGLSNAEIGRQLFITPGTVKVHVHHVFDKLGIRSRTALALNSARGRYAAPADTNPSEDEAE
jgi:DNA-binding CsgD family transcriptional regulator/tetratricopeptide (TPR) repeat protein